MFESEVGRLAEGVLAVHDSVVDVGVSLIQRSNGDDVDRCVQHLHQPRHDRRGERARDRTDVGVAHHRDDVPRRKVDALEDLLLGRLGHLLAEALPVLVWRGQVEREVGEVTVHLEVGVQLDDTVVRDRLLLELVERWLVLLGRQAIEYEHDTLVMSAPCGHLR